MDWEYVGMNSEGGVFQVDQDFDDAVHFARGEGEQRMIVSPQMIENVGELRGWGHGNIVLRLIMNLLRLRSAPVMVPTVAAQCAAENPQSAGRSESDRTSDPL